MDAPHDVGGRPTDATIPRGQHAFAPWEVRVDAIMMALTDPSRAGGPLMTVDQLRRGVESLSAQEYATLGYYQRWLRSLIAIMIERGAIDPVQLEQRAAAIAEEHELEHARANARDHVSAHELGHEQAHAARRDHEHAHTDALDHDHGHKPSDPT